MTGGPEGPDGPPPGPDGARIVPLHAPQTPAAARPRRSRTRAEPRRAVRRSGTPPVHPVPEAPTVADPVETGTDDPGRVDGGELPPDWEATLADALAFLRRRLTGDYGVDEFGFDADLTDSVILPLLRPLYRTWFRVETTGLHHVPDDGGALVVANHSGTVPLLSLIHI